MSCLVRPNNCELCFQGCHVTLWDCSSCACALNIPCPQPGRLSAQLLQALSLYIMVSLQFNLFVLNTVLNAPFLGVSQYLLLLLDERSFECCLSSGSQIPISSQCRQRTDNRWRPLSLTLPTWWDTRATWCSAGKPSPISPNALADSVSKFGLWHLSI